ncbi:MAG: hypothetical protein ACK5V3_11660 [Bdellovibrionales bacterium]
MRTLIVLSFLLLSYFFYGFYISQFEVGALRSQLLNDQKGPYYDYKGIINVHSRKSTGSGLIPQINDDAKMAGADFIIYTDINSFDSSPYADSYDGRLLVLHGSKHSYLDSRLIYYSPNEKTLGHSFGEVQTTLADLVTQNPQNRSESLVLLAHPFLKGFEWSGPLPEGLDGIELLNSKSMSFRAWNNSKLSVLWTVLIYPFNPQLSLFRLFLEPSAEIALLDQLSQERKIFAYAGSEATARAVPFAGNVIRFPTYYKTFEILSQHVLLESELTGSSSIDRNKILEALKKGSFYLCLDLLGNPKGFYTYIHHESDRWTMGSEIKWQKGMSLKVSLPEKPKAFFEVVIYKNGSRYKTVHQIDADIPLDGPGVYRVQVRIAQKFPLPDAIKWITWIYGNPYYVN